MKKRASIAIILILLGLSMFSGPKAYGDTGISQFKLDRIDEYVQGVGSAQAFTLLQQT